MNEYSAFPTRGVRTEFKVYLEALALVERLHRLLLDVIKDEFERLGILEINAHSEKMQKVDGLSESTITTLTQTLKELERFWTLQIRYIY